jgi:hypothetical protein
MEVYKVDWVINPDAKGQPYRCVADIVLNETEGLDSNLMKYVMDNPVLTGSTRSDMLMNWNPENIQMRLTSISQIQCDFIHINSIPICVSNRSVYFVQAWLKDSVELLPVYEINAQKSCYLIHFKASLDCLNLQESTYTLIGGRVSFIKKHVFKGAMLESALLFRLPYHPTILYATSKFVEVYRSAGLIGMDFIKVYPMP